MPLVKQNGSWYEKWGDRLYPYEGVTPDDEERAKEAISRAVEPRTVDTPYGPYTEDSRAPLMALKEGLKTGLGKGTLPFWNRDNQEQAVYNQLEQQYPKTVLGGKLAPGVVASTIAPMTALTQGTIGAGSAALGGEDAGQILAGGALGASIPLVTGGSMASRIANIWSDKQAINAGTETSRILWGATNPYKDKQGYGFEVSAKTIPKIFAGAQVEPTIGSVIGAIKIPDSRKEAVVEYVKDMFGKIVPKKKGLLDQQE